jgi:hypothetical protein
MAAAWVAAASDAVADPFGVERARLRPPRGARRAPRRGVPRTGSGTSRPRGSCSRAAPRSPGSSPNCVRRVRRRTGRTSPRRSSPTSTSSLGVAPFAPGSLSKEIRDALLPRRRSAPRCASRPFDATARRRSRPRTTLAAGADLALLGIGRNGHVAFNEPGIAVRRADARLSALDVVDARAASRRVRAGRVPRRSAHRRARHDPLRPGADRRRDGRREGGRRARAARRTARPVLSRERVAPARPRHAAPRRGGRGRPSPRRSPARAPYRGRRRPPARGSSSPTARRSSSPPHPDDASISCGGFARLAARERAQAHRRDVLHRGTRARSVARRSPKRPPTRESESTAEAADLGAEIRFLSAPRAYDSGGRTIPSDARRSPTLLDEIRPVRVFVPVPRRRGIRRTASAA